MALYLQSFRPLPPLQARLLLESPRHFPRLSLPISRSLGLQDLRVTCRFSRPMAVPVLVVKVQQALSLLSRAWTQYQLLSLPLLGPDCLQSSLVSLQHTDSTLLYPFLLMKSQSAHRRPLDLRQFTTIQALRTVIGFLLFFLALSRHPLLLLPHYLRRPHLVLFCLERPSLERLSLEHLRLRLSPHLSLRLRLSRHQILSHRLIPA